MTLLPAGAGEDVGGSAERGRPGAAGRQRRVSGQVGAGQPATFWGRLSQGVCLSPATGPTGARVPCGPSACSAIFGATPWMTSMLT